MNVLYQIVEFSACFIEGMIGVLVNVKVLGDTKIKWKESIAAVTLTSLVVFLINQMELFSLAATLVSILGIVINSCIIYKTKVMDSVVLSVGYFLLVYILDFLTVSVAGIVIQNEKFAADVADAFSLERLLYVVFAKGVLFLTYFFFLRKYLPKKKPRVWTILAGIVLCAGIVFYLAATTFEQIHINTVLLWFLLLLFVLLTVYTMNQYTVFLQEKYQLMLAKEKNSLTAEKYETVLAEYRKNQIFYHDIRNQYLVLENYLNNAEYEKAGKYMKELQGSDRGEPVRKQTGIDSLDILIAYKQAEAKENRIPIQIDAEPVSLQLTEQEAISLLGNALDNAMEACMELAAEDRWIQLTIRNVNDITFLQIRNPYREEPRTKSGRFLTGKKEKGLHGLGMESMKLIVNKYQGDMEVNYAEGVFAVSISFFH